MDLAKKYLQERGVKTSVQRLAIMKYLLENHCHPTVEDIFVAIKAQIPTISRTTIYNTMNLFVRKNVVSELTIDEKNIRFDIYTKQHAHFQCIGCGKILDIPINEEQIKKIENNTNNLLITNTRIYHTGFCQECAKKRKKDDN